MADFMCCIGSSLAPRTIGESLRWTAETRLAFGRVADCSWAVSRIEDLSLFGAASDRESGITILLGGRPAFESAEWAKAERLPFSGGLAARLVLDAYLTGGADAVAATNGAVTAIVLDERKRNGILTTDRMGFHPVFVSRQGALVVGSHPDVVAGVMAAEGLTPTLDEVTVAEFLKTGTATQPSTYWREVRQLDAGTIHALALDAPGGITAERVYWRPAHMEGTPALSTGEFVEAFSAALKSAGSRRSHAFLGRTAVLLSAGADSRGVLMSTLDPSDAATFTYYDEPNPELHSAKRIADLAGAQHHALQRASDYYIVHAAETARLSGGMWSVESGHHVGFATEIRRVANPGTLLTGCYADYLFKGVALNRRPRRLLGRNLPLYKPAPNTREFYLPFEPVDAAFDGDIEARQRARFAVAEAAADPRVVEWARLSPLAREGDAAGRHTLWRTLPFDYIFADSELLELYGRLSVKDKVSGLAFGASIAKVSGPRIAAISNNNYGAPVGGSASRRVAYFLAASARRKFHRALGRRSSFTGETVATVGSWPNLQAVALQSQGMRDWFAGAQGGPLWSYLTLERRGWELSSFATRGRSQLYRLLTVGLWQSAVDATIDALVRGVRQGPNSKED